MDNVDKICWNVTSRCNLKCEFCYANKDVLEGDLDKQKKIVSRLYDEGIREICFTGGEPLLLEYLPELLKFAKEKGIFVNLSTNATLLNEEIVSDIAEFVDLVSLPLDSLREDVIFSMRGCRDYLKKFEEVLKSLERAGVQVAVFTFVNPLNKKELVDIFEFLKKFGNVESWKVANYYPVGKCFDRFVLSDEEYGEVVEELSGWRADFEIVTRVKDENYQEKYFLMDPVGNVYTTTHHSHNVLGNVLEESLGDIAEKA
ncbi:radical SAM protein [Methanococcoides sp. SA1]|nr:radical SAM protein [Methanococcoides sp. SA1]